LAKGLNLGRKIFEVSTAKNLGSAAKRDESIAQNLLARASASRISFWVGYQVSTSEIPIIDVLGVDCRKRRKKEGKKKRTNPVQIIAPAASTTMGCRDISWMQSRTALFRIGYISYIASYAKTEASTISSRPGFLQIW
jgi:hypothetical protein